MKSFLITLASVWTWLVLAVCVVLWLPLLTLCRLFAPLLDPGLYATGLLFRKIAVVTATLNPLWRFRVTGATIPNPRRPYVVVSNHESFVDILLISHLPWEMKWLSKAELMRIPVLGWDMHLAGDIAVQRGTSRSALLAMRRCRDVLARKVSVIIFPEGTRSSTGELLPFKDGAFRLAIDAGVPILPLVVRGTGTALAKHDWRVGPSRAEVRVLEPIETTGLSGRDASSLRERVRELIARTREEMTPALGSDPGSPPSVLA
jgi:1-acyl-sn-glycerol-3-phosphate acyltransferase